MTAAPAAVRGGPERRPARLVLLLGLATLLLTGAAVGAAAPASSAVSPDHPGGAVWLSWLYLGLAAAAFACYAGALLALGRVSARLGHVLMVAIAIQAIPLAGPVLLSTDAYTYWARARVPAVHGGNPYVDAPSRYPGDPALERMGASWRDRPTGYGPAFTLVSEGHAAVAGESPATAAFLYRLLAAVALVALTGLAALIAGRSAFAAAFVGWNPLLALQFAGGGHNDAWVMVLVLGAVALAARGRPRAAGAAWAGAIGLKWFPAALLPLVVLESRGRGRGRAAVGFAAVALAVGGLATWRYGGEWLHALTSFSDQLGRTTSLAPASWLTAAGVPEAVAIAGLGALLSAVYAWLLREAWRGRARLGVCIGALLLTTSWLVPWYAVWIVPLAAIEEDRLARWLALGLSAYLLRGAVPL
ncbi:MAG: DUF2029 domain-containing protein [Thermoleophilia bacterium]|nr:DUF2029 domain-containing protein [Thermoleophilia bacterium]